MALRSSGVPMVGWYPCAVGFAASWQSVWMVESLGGMSGLPMARLMMSIPSAFIRATSFNLRLK